MDLELHLEPPSVRPRKDRERVKVEPVDLESPFGADEMFFSTTDLSGVIQAGNDVFVRVSCHERRNLIGAPHNLIRHPDMPRTVFQLLWDTIGAGKPIAAYVKNMAANGRYYWVLAQVFPLARRGEPTLKYVSVRLKPRAEIFGLITGVYGAMLQAERSGGIPAGAAKLAEVLASKGIPDYFALMDVILLEEWKVRLEEKGPADPFRYSGAGRTDALWQTLVDIYVRATQAEREYRTIFDELESMRNVTVRVGEESREYLRVSREIRTLSINASVQALKNAAMGAALAVIAREIRTNADEGEIVLSEATQSLDATRQLLGGILRSILLSLSQIAMIRTFAEELLDKLAAGSSFTPEEHRENVLNTTDLLHLLACSVGEISLQNDELERELRRSRRSLGRQKDLILGLTRIYTSGRIEVAAIGSAARNFHTLLERMSGQLESSRARLESLDDLLAAAQGAGSRIASRVTAVERGLAGIAAALTMFREIPAVRDAA